MELRLEQLTAEAFAPYGDVIQVEGNDFFHINNGKNFRKERLNLSNQFSFIKRLTLILLELLF